MALLFDNFIKTGVIEKEKEIVEGFKIKLRVLNTGELLIAESIMKESTAPVDIVARIRAASILSQSIISINGSKINRDDFSEMDVRKRRIVLYQQLLRMPAIVIQKTYEFYMECVNEQNSKYENFKETADEIRNF